MNVNSRKSEVLDPPWSVPVSQLTARVLNLLVQSYKARRGIRTQAAYAAELVLIALFAVLIGMPYFNLDPEIIPSGREFPSHVQSHHMWTRAAECGLCALWNGSSQGGAPMLVDVHGSMLHPIVILSTLSFGVINGTKVALIAALGAAGVGQWILARQLELDRIARVWTSFAAVAGGHLAGRMENGVVGVVLATASCAIAVPALLSVVRRLEVRPIVLAAVALFLVVSAGQGYIQIGFFLLLPIFLMAIKQNVLTLRQASARIVHVVFITLLFFSIFLIPFIHFYPQFYKDVDPSIRSGQRFLYSFLNLVIDDPQFFRADALGKMPFPNLYTTFIGWAPIIFALLALTLYASHRFSEMILFFAVYAGLAVWISTGAPLILLSALVPFHVVVDFVSSIRYPTYISGLAVQPILALAGMGFQHAHSFRWPRFEIDFSRGGTTKRSGVSSSKVLLILIAWNLAAEVTFASKWIQTSRQDPGLRVVLERFRTDSLQWVGPPFGEHFWSEIATGMNLKMYQGVRPWKWAGRELPQPVIDSNRSGVPIGMSLRETVNGVPIYAVQTGRDYASVHTQDGRSTACRARGIGGDLNVSCESATGGTLVVIENNWPGWSATIEGVPVRIGGDQWISVPIGPGKVDVALRYRPWDVAIGALLSLGGVSWCVWLWLRNNTSTDASQASRTDHGDSLERAAATER